MTPVKLPRILCVDDEPRVLESLALSLRREFEVHVAPSGEDALRMLGEQSYELICSDMRMPRMNGAVLLHRVMQKYPNITRILLTGEPGRDAAADAVNEGQIFRFLTKPCSSEKMKAALDAGIAHHRLMNAERVLLQETLVGCIKALTDVLAITNPVAFGRASRVKRLAVEFANHLGHKGFWQLEAASMLSQLGYLSLPVELVEKVYYGQPLTTDEKVLVSGVPEVANNLLGNIPRLEPVLQILAALNNPLDSRSQSTVGAKILAVVLDFDSLTAQGQSADSAIEQLKNSDRRHDAPLVDKLGEHLGAGKGTEEIRHMPLRTIMPGMVLMDDLRNEHGILLVPRGFEVSDSFVARMRNFGSKMLHEEVRVMIRHGLPLPKLDTA
jgi:CheY-like chemotaxis protein